MFKILVILFIVKLCAFNNLFKHFSCFSYTMLFCCAKTIRPNSTDYFIMKTSSKQKLQRIAPNNSSDIDFKEFMNLCKKCTAKPYSFFVIDATLASDNLLEKISELIMIVHDKIRDEKLQYDI